MFESAVIEPVYRAASNGWSRSATVLYPYDAGHVAPEMRRLVGKGVSGVEVDHGRAARDLLVATYVDEAVTHADLRLRGSGALVQFDGDGLRS